MKMKFFLVLLLAVLLPQAAQAAVGQTIINQASIDKDAVWSGKVVVEQPLNVPKGTTLTVKAGTEVRFKKGAGLTVEGVLKAAGKNAAPVVFTSDEKAPAPGDWTGISLVEAKDGTILKRCSISYAGSVSVSVCSPPITDCEIVKGAIGIALARKARPVISGCEIRDMSQGGINCQMGSAPTITGNTIERCRQYAITSSQDSQPTIQGNTLSTCETGISLATPVPPITDNTFKGNKTGLFLSSVGTGMIVRGNHFTGNETGLVCQQFSNPIIEKNEITGNKKEGLVCFRAASPLVRNNEITGNERGIVCIQICSPRLTGNNIHDNKTGVYLDLSSYAIINGNNIYENEIEVELGNMSSDWENRVNQKPERGSQAQNMTMASRGKAPLQRMEDSARIMGYVDATGNWWGQAVTQEMEEKGQDANIKSFIDYYDVPTRTYEGYSGIYIQDRIKYEGWKKSRIRGAGL